MRVIDALARTSGHQGPHGVVRTGSDAAGVTFCAGGKCPDVLMAWEQTYAGLADRGVLLDLNSMLARDPAFAAQLKADSIPALYDTFTFNDGQYALPEQWSGNFLFYNRKLFADAGLRRHPLAGTGWSFAEFLGAAKP